ncbi:MAG: Asp-tRNA(Asn)/Glu-tRNA(Gln) amidotransferase subunit GatC [Acidobacteria bacterium]|jgi:aspartyl-tRNA(Asn)/glutamyl-tRNA(Gln) amidotransferase subunit C|nr:Asp-tRNA(Asn)/Glu-tRNA(Gln) amidotransferase subunit GatC [Acidobacteriota bacterium]MCU0253219.1 Asp-tRNA(Asn)/Glu-tRNA(Gln) amidotransferase subunit GatC [Acidobacteriota bacterium]
MGRDLIADAEVRRIAALARLALTEDEVRRMARELSAILGYVAALDALALPDDEPAAPPGAPPARPDETAPPLDAADVLDGAPRAANGHFLVPRVIGP